MKNVVAWVILLVGINGAFGQEAETFEEGELAKYAEVMVWAEQEKTRMTLVYNDWINGSETLEATRFLKIKQAIGDEASLQAIEATSAEINAFNEIQKNYDSLTSSFKESYIGKIKSEIGASLYNSLKKALKSDEALRNRYQTVYDRLSNAEVSTEEDETE